MARRITEALPISGMLSVRSGAIEREVRLVGPGGIVDPFRCKMQSAELAGAGRP